MIPSAVRASRWMDVERPAPTVVIVFPLIVSAWIGYLNVTKAPDAKVGVPISWLGCRSADTGVSEGHVHKAVRGVGLALV
jgi:hypothetical protein